jgi:hypothetical protein
MHKILIRGDSLVNAEKGVGDGKDRLIFQKVFCEAMKKNSSGSWRRV